MEQPITGSSKIQPDNTNQLITANKRIKTLNDGLLIIIGDDSGVDRKLISKVVDSISGAKVIGTSSNGALLISKVKRLQPDLVLFDLEMPVDKSLETLKALKASSGLEVVIMSSTYDGDSAPVSKLLDAGAIEYVPKLMSSDEKDIREFRLQMLTIVGLVRSRRNLHMAEKTIPARKKPGVTFEMISELPLKVPQASPRSVHPVNRRTSVRPARIDVITIGVSTGGPNALGEVIPQLPSDLDVPILMVQHMPPLLTASLASSLDAKSELTVKEAEDDEIPKPNVVYIAPGGNHMVVIPDVAGGSETGIIKLNLDPPENSVRPAADVLFRSLPQIYGSRVLAVIMTGMGNDGKKGVIALREKGCYCITQSAETCVVYGMPRAVDESNLSDESVPLDMIARKIKQIIRGT